MVIWNHDASAGMFMVSTKGAKCHGLRLSAESEKEKKKKIMVVSETARRTLHLSEIWL